MKLDEDVHVIPPEDNDDSDENFKLFMARLDNMMMFLAIVCVVVISISTLIDLLIFVNG